VNWNGSLIKENGQPVMSDFVALLGALRVLYVPKTASLTKLAVVS